VVIIGFVLIAAAVASATILITQNTARVQFHALGHAWTGSMYWLLVAGLIILAVAVIGVLAVRLSGTRRLRRERAALAEQNQDLADQLGLTTTDAAQAPAEQRTRAAPHRRHHIFHRRRAAM
jgi:uncharacterized integral membrane protein